MKPIEQSQQYGLEWALIIAFAAIIASPIINWLIMRFQERGLNKRLGAQRHWQLADQFRLEAAALLSKTNEQACQMLRLQEFGFAKMNENPAEFNAWMNRVDELSLDASRVGQSVHLLIDRDSEEGKALVLAMIQLSDLVDRTVNPKFHPERPEEPIFSNLGNDEDIANAAAVVSAIAARILDQLERAPK